MTPLWKLSRKIFEVKGRNINKILYNSVLENHLDMIGEISVCNISRPTSFNFLSEGQFLVVSKKRKLLTWYMEFLSNEQNFLTFHDFRNSCYSLPVKYRTKNYISNSIKCLKKHSLNVSLRWSTVKMSAFCQRRSNRETIFFIRDLSPP